MARPVIPLLIVALFAVALFVSVVPGAEASHAHGHRFMIHGQILDADGEPAQNILVTLAATAAQQPHPQMTISTDCHGFFYSQAARQGDWDAGLDDGRLHLHPSFPTKTAEWRRSPPPEFFISTPYADYRNDSLPMQRPLSEDELRQYAVYIGEADYRGTQSTIANVQLDVSLDRDPACEGQDEPVFLVRGKVQVIEQRTRVDQITLEHQGQIVVGPNEVEVTVQTTEGPVTQTVTTDRAAMYEARFTNVTVEPGAQITAEWEGHERSTTAGDTFAAVNLDIVHRQMPWHSAGFQIFLGAIAVVALLAVGAWGVLRTKDQMEIKKAKEQSTRKRSN
jgi:hypothetical protein